MNLNYSDPQDAEPDFPGLGNVNQAYEGEDLQEPHDKVASHPNKLFVSYIMKYKNKNIFPKSIGYSTSWKMWQTVVA